MSVAPPLARIPVGVVVERRKATSAWIEHVWVPVAVLAGEPSTPPWTMLSQDGDTATFFVGVAPVELYRSETGNYRDNLASGSPQIWVVLRPTEGEPPFELAAVTADPAEGEGYTQTGTDLVEPVPMPDPLREVIAAFVAEHHVERPFVTRKRDRADPEARGRRGRVGDER